jgi:hypothetical protein
MTPDTFRTWLAERGCSFEQHGRSEGGLPSVTVRRGGRSAVLYDATSRKDLDPDQVRQVVEALDLDPAELPGPASRR